MNNASRSSLPDAYWVIPGRLMAGAYPASKYFDEETRQKLGQLLSAGANFFLNLTEEGELPAYDRLLKEQAALHDLQAEHRRIAIADMHTPEPALMKRILDAIDAAVNSGKVVYVHCYAGIGRTGSVVGCYLARHGLDGAEALNTIARLRASLPNGWVRSPETDDQVDLVLNWPRGE